MNFGDVYRGKTVLVTGGNGFKGAWLCAWLEMLGAKVISLGLRDWPNQYIFNHSKLPKNIKQYYGDIRELSDLREIFLNHTVDFVFHLAAQPIVRESFDRPIQTIKTNVIGTLNILECVRLFRVKGAVFITSDKCYKNVEQDDGYKEDDKLEGSDPYSASKSCAEVLIQSYRQSFPDMNIASVRAGNIIGGGDYSKDRLVPDCIRALKDDKDIIIRNPESTRPWNFVLETLRGYLMVGQKLLEGDKDFRMAFNFGPTIENVVEAKIIAEKIVELWGKGNIKFGTPDETKHEHKKLALNIDKAKEMLGWEPVLSIDQMLKFTIDFYKDSGHDLIEVCQDQIGEYVECVKNSKK